MSCWVRLLLCGRHLHVWSGDTPMHCLAMAASGLSWRPGLPAPCGAVGVVLLRDCPAGRMEERLAPAAAHPWVIPLPARPCSSVGGLPAGAPPFSPPPPRSPAHAELGGH